MSGEIRGRWQCQVSKGITYISDGPIPERMLDGYRFDNLVVGEWNRKAVNAIRLAARRPRSGPAPIWLWSDPGMGKTHLAAALASAWARGGLRGLIVKTTAFVSLVGRTIHGALPPRVNHWFGRHDFVIFEAVQYLTFVPGFNEAWSAAFGFLISAGRSVVVTSDRPPESMGCPIFKLAPVFRRGAVLKIDAPDRPGRQKLLTAFCLRAGLGIPRSTIARAARTATSNVRALEGNVIRLTACRDSNLSVDQEDVERFLGA